MLYCFSQAVYDKDELVNYLRTVTENDAVVLWQDGVLLAIKFPHLFKHCKGHCFVLEQDVSARNLTALLSEESQVQPVSLADLVAISEKFFPQMAL